MKPFQRFALSGLFLLAACGFSPIYGSHGDEGTPVAEALSSVFISNIPNEDGQKLRNRLMDRMYFHGRPQDPLARLDVSLSSSESGLGIQKDATTSLSELTMNASYTLRGMDSKQLLAGTAKSIVIYSKLDAQYGTLAAQRNAYDRAITELCEQIVSRISLYYAQTPPLKTAIVRPVAKHGNEAGKRPASSPLNGGWALDVGTQETR